MNRESHDEKADGLFPAPSPPPTVLCPQRLPGCGIESLKALRHVLIDNHTRHHIYFNNTKFHNHVTHRALAIYAMGGSGPVIEAFYKQDSEMQRPAFASPKLITEQNFVEHLGDENFYEAYTSFFNKVIEEKGAAATFEEFMFSEKYNSDPRRDAASQPEMLSRFVDGVMHPLIHCGYGVEFGLKGMLSEGLAMTALQDTHTRKFLSPSAAGKFRRTTCFIEVHLSLAHAPPYSMSDDHHDISTFSCDTEGKLDSSNLIELQSVNYLLGKL